MSLISLTTSARDGNLRAPRRLQRFLKFKKWPTAVATAQQVHGVRVDIVPLLRRAREYAQADGLLTAENLQPLGIFTADCLPIFLEDPRRKVIGVLHGGWRGVRGQILAKAVRQMQRMWKCRPADIRYWLGPAIGPCCFKVNWDVARFFPFSRYRKGDQWRVDLAHEIHRQAKRLGLGRARKPSRPCTMHYQRYFSFRRNQTSDRQISMIMRTLR